MTNISSNVVFIFSTRNCQNRHIMNELHHTPHLVSKIWDLIDGFFGVPLVQKAMSNLICYRLIKQKGQKIRQTFLDLAQKKKHTYVSDFCDLEYTHFFDFCDLQCYNTPTSQISVISDVAKHPLFRFLWSPML